MKIKTLYPLLLMSLLLVTACDDEPATETEQTDDTVVVIDPDIVEEDRLPLFQINTNGGTIVDEPKIDAQLSIITNGETTHTGAIGIEIRGSSSQQFPKKSYGFETRDANNADLDVSLLNLPEEEDWILSGPYSDKALVRNHLIYSLSNEMNRYASRSRLVEVALNGQYSGVYVFMEKLKRDVNRIDIAELNIDENEGEDLTGGYILKIDKAEGSFGDVYTSENSFTSTFLPPNATGGQQIHFVYEEPESEFITDAQKNYIAAYVNDFEEALAAPTFTDPDLGYAAYIDADSFIDFFLLTELANNVDGYRLSTYLTKDKNEKLKMGPIWDFNLAFGNADYCGGALTDVWAYRFNERCSDDTWQIPFWWQRLLEDPAFVSQLQARWNQLRAGIFDEGNLNAHIDSYVALMDTGGAIEANFDKWPVLGVYVWPNSFIGDTYEEETDFLKDWIGARLSWMDTAVNGL